MKDRSPLYPCNPSEHRRKLPSQVWLTAAAEEPIEATRADPEGQALKMYQKP
jgi:hypothetical protein